MNTKSKIIVGIVGAAAAGVVIGLLLAPEKGSDLRKTIKNTTGSWTDHLADLFTDAKDELGSLRKKGNRGADDAANKFNNIKESYS